MHKLIHFLTRKPVHTNNLIFTGKDCPWEVEIDFKHVRQQLNLDYFKKLPAYVSKYLSFLPISSHKLFTSLGEGGTPLIKSKKLAKNISAELYFKLEAQNPSNSFKDRGSAVEISIAKEKKAKAVVLASTGNMAASCACYAASADIPCFVFVPEGTPASKLAQVIVYGGHVVQVKGSYGDASRVAEEVARKLNFYLAGDYAYRIEGQKTAAFEVIDQLFFEVPDYVIIPMGCGTNIASYYKGFVEYQEVGLIKSIPHLIGVQASGASPIINSFKKRKRTFKALDKISTVASAIAINKPLDGIKALASIYNSKGKAIAVSDREMFEAQSLLAKIEGQFVELSSAATFAALKKLSRQVNLKNKKIVCVLTGSGLKDPNPILDVTIKPPTISPSAGDFIKLYKDSFYKKRKYQFNISF